MPDKWVKTRQPVDWFYSSFKATGNYKEKKVKPETNKLRSCPNCGNTIKRNAGESWPHYALKTACSIKCAALIRHAKERDAENAGRALEMALRNWRVA
jgi:hypothetical protein